VGLDRPFALALHPTHLLGMLVVVRECVVDVGEPEVVPVRNLPGVETDGLDPLVDEPDRDSTPRNVGLVVEVRFFGRHDPVDLFGHPMALYPAVGDVEAVVGCDLLRGPTGVDYSPGNVVHADPTPCDARGTPRTSAGETISVIGHVYAGVGDTDR
jgi:hypothetical protein